MKDKISADKLFVVTVFPVLLVTDNRKKKLLLSHFLSCDNGSVIKSQNRRIIKVGKALR